MIFSQSASEWVFIVSIRRSNLCIKGLCCLSFRMMVGPGAGWLGWGVCVWVAVVLMRVCLGMFLL